MGLFSFGKKVKLYAPVDGTLIDLATVAAGQTGFCLLYTSDAADEL